MRRWCGWSPFSCAVEVNMSARPPTAVKSVTTGEWRRASPPKVVSTSAESPVQSPRLSPRIVQRKRSGSACSTDIAKFQCESFAVRAATGNERAPVPPSTQSNPSIALGPERPRQVSSADSRVASARPVDSAKSADRQTATSSGSVALNRSAKLRIHSARSRGLPPSPPPLLASPFRQTLSLVTQEIHERMAPHCSHTRCREEVAQMRNSDKPTPPVAGTFDWLPSLSPGNALAHHPYYRDDPNYPIAVPESIFTPRRHPHAATKAENPAEQCTQALQSFDAKVSEAKLNRLTTIYQTQALRCAQ